MIKESVVDEFARLRGKMNDFRGILWDISGHLTTVDVQELKFLCRDHIPPGRAQTITNAIELFLELENLGLLTDTKREFLASKLTTIRKRHLVDKLLGIQGKDIYVLGLANCTMRYFEMKS